MTLLQDYTNWIVEFSKQYPIKEENKLMTYISGIGEELLEFEESIQSYASYEESIKELGDVLAYVCLAAHKLDMNLSEAYSCYGDFSAEHIALLTLGTTKRYFRGDTDVTARCEDIVIRSLYYVIHEIKYKYSGAGTTLEEVITINKDKLTKRATNKTLVGTGDNR